MLVDVVGVVTEYWSLEHTHIHTGDRLVISEQSLDQRNFIVKNLRTGSQGTVQTEFVKIGECVCATCVVCVCVTWVCRLCYM